MLRVVPDKSAEQGLAPRRLGEFAVGERAAVPLLLVAHDGDEPLLAISVSNMHVAATAPGPDGRVLVELVDDVDGRTVTIDAAADAPDVVTDDPSSAWCSALDLIVRVQHQLEMLRDYAVVRVAQAQGRPVGDLSPSEDIMALLPRGVAIEGGEVFAMFSPGGAVSDWTVCTAEGEKL